MDPRAREHGGARHYFKDVECFDCGNKFTVGRAARSANCYLCGGYICLEDIEIDGSSTTSIRTRGDVLVRESGNLQAAEVSCRNLQIHGELSAAILCTDELRVRATGTIIGEVRCRKFVVEEGSDVHFMNPILAEEADVRGRMLGNIECSGQVSISGQGLVQGDVMARAVTIGPGGQLDGSMNIVRGAGPRPEPKTPRDTRRPGAES